jgi:uncharacterized protein YktB (UPF0637 family)
VKGIFKFRLTDSNLLVLEALILSIKKEKDKAERLKRIYETLQQKYPLNYFNYLDSLKTTQSRVQYFG